MIILEKTILLYDKNNNIYMERIFKCESINSHIHTLLYQYTRPSLRISISISNLFLFLQLFYDIAIISCITSLLL